MTRIGLLVPHFGEFASKETILDLSVEAEQLGYQSFWVRDHLVWEPHGMEGSNNTFLDPFITLASLAAVLTDSVLGTGVIIPTRWPLKLAQNFSSLSFLNNGNIVAGIGLGANPLEFAAAGFAADDREQIFIETVEILHKAWNDEVVEYSGEIFNISDVTIRPKPVEDIPIIYGGSSPAAVRRAVRHTVGWYPGRLPIDTLKARLEYLEVQTEKLERRRDAMNIIIQPLVVIGDTTMEAVERVPIEEVAHSSEGAKFWKTPASGGFETISDLRGLVVAGTSDEVLEQLEEIISLGIDEIIVDLRLQFDRYPEAMRKFGHEVLPRLK